MRKYLKRSKQDWIKQIKIIFNGKINVKIDIIAMKSWSWTHLKITDKMMRKWLKRLNARL